MTQSELVSETTGLAVYRGKRLDERVNLLVKTEKLREMKIFAHLVGSADLLYDQIATSEGKITLLDIGSIIVFDWLLKTRGFRTYSQHDPEAGYGLSVNGGEMTIPELAKVGIRLHNQINGTFAYDVQTGELRGVLRGENESAGQTKDRTNTVRNHTVHVWPGTTAPHYNVALPQYDLDEIYVDHLRFVTEQVIGGIHLDLIDQGIRDYMREQGIKEMTLLAFFKPNLAPYKQVVIYHDELKSFESLDIPCICDHPREEFHIRPKILGWQTPTRLLNE